MAKKRLSGFPFISCPWQEFILVITAALLFLGNLGYLSPEFTATVDTYWPMGLLIYAVLLIASKNGCKKG